MPLTDTAIRALKPKSVRYSRSDERGLVLEVFPTGGMLWHYRYRLNGRQERVTLGRYPALSLKLARAERDKRETLVCRRRVKFEPPCRLNFEPGVDAGVVMSGCG
jgi:hypothetical protein